MARKKKLNDYSTNEDGSVNIHAGEEVIAIVDLMDVIRTKPCTWSLRKRSGHVYPMTSKNTKCFDGKYKTTHKTLGKFLTGAKVTKYIDGNPKNCRRSNLKVG